MIDALYIAGSGIQTQQTYVDVISNNIANVNTIGYKRESVSFSDMVSGSQSANGSSVSQSPIAFGGNGATINEIRPVFEDGDLRATDSELDLAISGRGFFEVELENGEQAYTRVGKLSINTDGKLATATGQILSANITVPLDAKSIEISSTGEVHVSVPNETNKVYIGELELAKFSSPSELDPAGYGLYKATDSSGLAYYGKPGEAGFGDIRQGFVEVSNVSMVAEMVNLMLAQRAYQLNARVVQTADQLMETANNLTRG
ncbi:flagellar basal-body rod protein FlgG [Photobacterium kasasachensis]|uniref:flagellar basal-body rod protein FlgG n=1 Tax=Photobacterium kasasachensis TaxID=2910240 RepID=UPI003D0C8946